MKLKSILSKSLVALLLPVLFCFSSTACSKSKGSDGEKEVKSNFTTIKYVGNSCFYITFSDGTRLVTDPYGSAYATQFGIFPKLEADVITISHSHADHIAGIIEVTGKPKNIMPEDLNKTIKVGNVEITGYASNHVANMGGNTIFVYKENGLKIVHMGETDNIDSNEVQKAIKDADVILAYAGEYGEVKNKDSFENLNKMNIKVMIPQHYSINADNIFYGEPTIDKILTELPQGTKVTKTNEFIVKKGLEKQFVELSPMDRK